MINYTDIILEAYEDNHIDYVELFNSKEKLSIKKDQIEVMYIDWFMNKAQIIERDFFIQPETFIENCLKRVILLMQSIKGNKKRENEYIEFVFIFTSLGQMIKVMNEPEQTELFESCLINIDNKEKFIEKIRNLLLGAKNKRVAHLIIWLVENNKINYQNRKKLYDAIRSEFNVVIKDSGVNDFLSDYEKTTGLAKIKSVQTIEYARQVQQDKNHDKYSLVRKIDLKEYEIINDTLK